MKHQLLQMVQVCVLGFVLCCILWPLCCWGRGLTKPPGNVSGLWLSWKKSLLTVGYAPNPSPAMVTWAMTHAKRTASRLEAQGLQIIPSPWASMCYAVWTQARKSVNSTAQGNRADLACLAQWMPCSLFLLTVQADSILYLSEKRYYLISIWVCSWAHLVCSVYTSFLLGLSRQCYFKFDV